MPVLLAGLAGYVYGLLDDDGITTGKVVTVAIAGAGVYYLIKKAK